MIRPTVAIRRVAEKDRPIHQKQRRPVQLAKGVEGNLAPDAPVASSRNRRRDDDRARGLFRAGGDVERVQAMDEDAAFLRVRFDVHGSGCRVNDRSAGDPNLRNQVGAADVRAAADRGGAGGCAVRRVNQAGLPQRARVRSRIVVSVKRVHAVAFCGYENNVVRPFARDRYIGQIQRLRVDVSVHRLREELAEGTHGHVLRRQHRLIRIRAAAGVVVVVRRHVHLRCGEGCRRHDS